MQKQITVGRWEAVCLLLNTINIQIFLNLPRYIVEIAGTSGWILSIYISILVLLIFSIVLMTFRKFPGKDIVDIAGQVAGKTGQVLVGMSFSLLSFFAASLTLREFSEDMKTIALTTSPLSYIMVFFLLGIIIATYLGFEMIIRIQGLIIPIIVIGFFIIILSVSPFIQFDNVLPIMGNGLPKILGEGFFKVSLFIGISMIYWLPPFLKTFARFKSVSYIALLLSGFFIITSVLVYSTVFPYPTATESFLPIYNLSRLIGFGRFFQRIEPLFLIVWTLSAFLYLSACLYCAIYGFKRAFNIPYVKPLVIPFSILVYNVAFLPRSIMSTIELDRIYLRTWGFVPAFGIPIILLIMAWIRGKKAPNAGKEK